MSKLLVFMDARSPQDKKAIVTFVSQFQLFLLKLWEKNAKM